jgi:GNAT superfamily N-acetyltransferase
MRDRPPAGHIATRDDVTFNWIERPKPDWYRALFRKVGAPWLWASRLTLGEDELLHTIQDPNVEIRALFPTSSREPIGIVELDFRNMGQCEVAFFGLAVDWTRRGIGRWMMAQTLNRAWADARVQRVWIHTCTLDDPAALPFYLSCGFRAYARQVEVLPDPRLVGHLPISAAPHIPFAN